MAGSASQAEKKSVLRAHHHSTRGGGGRRQHGRPTVVVKNIKSLRNELRGTTGGSLSLRGRGRRAAPHGETNRELY